MTMTMRKATKEDFTPVMELYYHLIDSMAEAEFKPAWKKGVYPTEQFIRESIDGQQLFIAVQDDAFAGVMVLNHSCAEGYEKVQWGIDAQPEEIAVIHALAVCPLFQGKGVAKHMVQHAVEHCRQSGIKAIRLDVLTANLPAQRVYEKIGFRHVDTISLFYEDTGLTEFLLYELIIE